MEIIIKVHHFWTEELLVKRIARVVCHTDAHVQLRRDGYKWDLDYSGNNWWASALEDRQIKIAYRYGNESKMEAVKVVLEWLLN